MLFKKTREVAKQLKRKETEQKERIKKQRSDAKNTSIFQAIVSQIQAEINMLLDSDPTAESIILETDNNTFLLLNQYILGKEFEDYDVTQISDSEFEIKYKELIL